MVAVVLLTGTQDLEEVLLLKLLEHSYMLSGSMTV